MARLHPLLLALAAALASAHDERRSVSVPTSTTEVARHLATRFPRLAASPSTAPQQVRLAPGPQGASLGRTEAQERLFHPLVQQDGVSIQAYAGPTADRDGEDVLLRREIGSHHVLRSAGVDLSQPPTIGVEIDRELSRRRVPDG
jgi:hypothetical protein